MTSCSFKPKTSSVRVLESFWPTQNVDPIALVSAGDWNMLQNLLSPLVLLGPGRAVFPGLAESWTQSSDGKQWSFKLREGLKWSDGSPIYSVQIQDSLRRALAKTTHTSLSSYVDGIHAVNDREIQFSLTSMPENFLMNLAFVDASIVHPSSLTSGAFSWSAPSSGAYRVSSLEFFGSTNRSREKSILLESGSQSNSKHSYDPSQGIRFQS